MPESTPPSVRVVFRGFVNGQVAFPSRAVSAGDPPVPIKIAVTGGHTLLLDVETEGAPDGHSVVPALWGEPRLLSSR